MANTKSDIWSIVIADIRRDGHSTDEEVANALGAGITNVAETLREMGEMGWVEHRDDGSIHPGDEADEFLG
ncbi:hypothetical protein AUR64_17295 [Haloprofundus marisrubri]|uniref:MarR family transcriptional regulator n=1 Tax=Haloprofundus marisrubri TaxID=1514971 RepID=A0A0W1R8Q5_9EURY|nr:hypothetical protein [Haloprofundus marisrubri]KTG09522.1 hypothetical protein AUR64_17295 [Haloprofundus marisrubri]